VRVKAAQKNGCAAALSSRRCSISLAFGSRTEAFHHVLVARGTLYIQPPRDAFGAKHAVYADPDGLPFSVAGSLKKGPADQGLQGSER
jgi:hypothetical protein